MDFEGKETEIIFWVLVVIAAALIWHFFVRRRCPKCNSTNFELINSKELDRWIGTKEVSENLGNGKTRKKHVQTTFVNMQYTYHCLNCDYKWEETKKEEK